MAYGTVKVDNVTFTYNSADATTTFSGFYASTTNNLTLSGTASAATFTGTTANFTNVNAQNISVTTALSGLAITGGTAGFTTVTGTTVTGTTANFVSGVFTTQVSGTTITGTTASFTSGVFTSLSGTTHTITSGVFASGTAALPSISFVSDPNTGVFSPGADQLAVATNGVERVEFGASEVVFNDGGTDYDFRVEGDTSSHLLFVDASTDRVGIGTSAPSALLHVLDSSSTTTTPLILRNYAASVNTKVRIALQGATASNQGAFAFIQSLAGTDAGGSNSNNDSGLQFIVTNGGGATENQAMTINTQGRVGIGTTSVSETLHLKASAPRIRMEDAEGGYSNIEGDGGSLGIYADNGNTQANSFIRFDIDGTEKSRLTSSGQLLVGTTSATGANLLQVNSDALVNGITVGRGLASISTNTAVGNSALNANTTGTNNTAIGKEALILNTTGSNNTAIGISTLSNITTASSNTAVGQGALYLNTTGTDNNAVGRSSLSNNTTGSNNSALGRDALVSNTTGTSNIATGHQSLYSNTTANNNTANGEVALYSNTTGTNNTGLGYFAGYGTVPGTNSNTTGSNNTFLGSGSVGASATASNVITLGNGSIATLRCQVTTITALSDARDKTNITNIPAGLDFINALRPVAFDWNMRDGGKVGIHEFGFIAQELQEAQASTGITVPNLVSTENPDKLEASAGTLLPVLVNAVQELTAMVRDLQAELSILKGAQQ